MEPTKKCTKCGQVKELELFNRKTKSPDGRQSVCRKCHRIKYQTSKSRKSG